MAKKAARSAAIDPPDWVGIGGWSPRFARILIEAYNDQLAFGLIDTNGDGCQLAAEVVMFDEVAGWQLVQYDDDSAEIGRWWTPNVVAAWGHGAGRETVVLDYLGAEHVVHADRSGRWAFVAATAPHAAEGVTPSRLR